MKDIRKILDGTAGPVGLAALGAIMLAAVVVPSPARLDLWTAHPVAIADIPFPEAPHNISDAELAAVVERPLFNYDRKKDPPPEEQNALPGLDTYRLAGVIITGSTNVAIIERKQEKTSATVKMGTSLDGRTVTAITAEGVTLSSGGRSDILALPKIVGASKKTQTQSASKQ